MQISLVNRICVIAQFATAPNLLVVTTVVFARYVLVKGCQQMCVVNMDHHCPWFCNCIGYQNKKFFFLCLFYAWIGCLDIVLSLLYKYIFASSRSYFSFKYYSPLSFLWQNSSCLISSGVLAFALFLTLTFFGGFHFLLIVWDQTTIEANSFFRNTFFHVDNEKRGKISYFENWCLVMDRKWYLVWILLIDESSGSSLFMQRSLNLSGISYMFKIVDEMMCRNVTASCPRVRVNQILN